MNENELSENEPELTTANVDNTEIIETSNPEQTAQSDQEINWKRANDVMRAQKYKIEELEKKLASLPAPVKPIEPQTVVDDDDFEIDPDDYVTGAMLKKMHAKTAKLENELRQTREQSAAKAQQELIARSEAVLKSQLPDYDAVIENFTLPLIQSDPATAQLIKMSADPAALAYSLGKTELMKQGAAAEKNPTAQKILKNNAKPSSVFASGNSLKSQAEAVSNMSKDETWRLAQQYAQGG